MEHQVETTEIEEISVIGCAEPPVVLIADMSKPGAHDLAAKFRQIGAHVIEGNGA